MTIAKAESAALLGDRAAMIQIVSALRRYRSAVASAKSAAYSGTIDKIDGHALFDAAASIERDLADWGDE